MKAALWHTSVAVGEVPDHLTKAEAQAELLRQVDAGEIVFESTCGDVEINMSDRDVQAMVGPW